MGWDFPERRHCKKGAIIVGLVAQIGLLKESQGATATEVLQAEGPPFGPRTQDMGVEHGLQGSLQRKSKRRVRLFCTMDGEDQNKGAKVRTATRYSHSSTT